jgi:hypothetical protein
MMPSLRCDKSRGFSGGSRSSVMEDEEAREEGGEENDEAVE